MSPKPGPKADMDDGAGPGRRGGPHTVLSGAQ